MNPSFIEELFFKIDERLISLEKELGMIRADLAVISDEIMRCRECRTEMQDVKRWFVTGKSVAMVVWGLVITAINVLIGKLIEITKQQN